MKPRLLILGWLLMGLSLAFLVCAFFRIISEEAWFALSPVATLPGFIGALLVSHGQEDGSK